MNIKKICEQKLQFTATVSMVVYFMEVPHNKLDSNAKFKSQICTYQSKLKILLSFHSEQLRKLK